MEGIWQFIVGLVILAAIVGIPGYFYLSSQKDMRSRVAAGRDALGALWDIALVRIGAAGIAILTFVIIVGFVFPTLRSEGEKYKGKTEGGDIVIMAVNNPQGLPGLVQQYGKAAIGGTQLTDPWASSNSSAPAAVAAPTSAPAPAAAAPAAQQPVVRADIPVFVGIKFSDGKSRDVCAVRADTTGTYNIAVLCDENDKVSSNTLSLAGADMTPLAGKLPAAPTPIPTSIPTVAPTQGPVTAPPVQNSPLLFEKNQAAAECFWAELLKRKGELGTFGTALLPSGSSWVVKTKADGWHQFWEDEDWTLCSVKWGWCLTGLKWSTAEKLATKDVALAGEVFFGTGNFPDVCVPTSNP